VIQRQSHEDDRAERFYGLAWRWAHLLSMFGVWTVRCMDELTNDAIREIEQVHSKWIEYEVAGDDHNLMTLCADDIELWPPNAQTRGGFGANGPQDDENSLHRVYPSAYSGFKRDCLLDRKLQNYVLLSGRLHS
jgi:hypothetical protein